MKGTKNFIIQIDNPYNETFKTENGVELYGNVDFTTERQSNRIAKVVGIPSLFETEIKVGFEVLIDASILYRQIYNSVKQWYRNVVDADKNLFHIEKNMIVCYRENPECVWIGFNENSLVKPIMEEQKIDSNLILPETTKTPKFSGKVNMIYSNTKLNTLGVHNGSTLHINKLGGVDFWLNGIKHWWLRNKDIYAIELKSEI